MGRGKEIKIDLPFNYNVVSGTVDNKNPKSIYIQISAWGKPKKEDELNYDLILRNKAKTIKKKLFNILDENTFYKKRSIVDFNMASSGISSGKRSYMSVEMTLFKKEPLLPINSIPLIEKINNISENLILDFFDKDIHFEFYKTKGK